MLSDRYLEELQDPAHPVSASKLLNLSGLAAPEVEHLRSYWNAMSEERRLQVIRQMGEVAEDNPEVDFQQVFRLGLHDPETEVRVQAIEGLWECQERWLIGELVELMTKDPEIEVRSTAASHMGKFALLGELEEMRPRDIATVRQALLDVIHNRDEELDVRRRAVEAISPFSDDAINDVIREAYHSDALKMRASALYAMGVHCDPAWLPAVLTELKSDNPEMRFEAVRACGELEDEHAVPALIETVRDEDLQVREAAVEALGRVGGRRAKQALKRMLTADDPTLQEAARAALEELEISENPLTMPYQDER